MTERVVKFKIDDIAKMIGVSSGTVSNALNNRKGVSKEKANEIKELAKKLGYDNKIENYRSNTIRLLICKKNGIVVENNPFIALLMEGIETECRNIGYELMVSHIELNSAQSEIQLNSVMFDKVDGLLLLGTELNDEDIFQFMRSLKPIVVLDSDSVLTDFDVVQVNNEHGIKQAINHLIDNQHRNIGYLHSSIYTSNFNARYRGYIMGMMDNKLQVNQANIIDVEPTISGAQDDMSKYLEKADIMKLPTALVCDNDLIALGAMRALSDFGIKIPDNISIIGFDDLQLCEFSIPKLTTMQVCKQTMGAIAVRRLFDKINKRDTVITNTLIRTNMIIRESVKPIE